jgi:hypothetical protein
MNFKYKSEIKLRLEDYLKLQGININRPIQCLNNNLHKNDDKKPSMSFKHDMLYCFVCNTRFDVYMLIGHDYGLKTFKDQYEKACLLFGYQDEFNNIKYKQNMQEIKSNIINIKEDQEKKYIRFNKFCDKLTNKKREMINIISLIEDKNTVLYQDYQFKINFIDKFLLDNLECNSQSLENIKNFNKVYELEYNNFRKYFLEIM